MICCRIMQPEAQNSFSSADADVLRAQLAEVLQQNTSLREDNSGLRETVDELKRQLDVLQRLLFSPKSERFVVEPDPQQGWLFPDMEVKAPLPPSEPETDQPMRS